MSKRLRVLLLCDDRRDHASTVLDHIDAFGRYSRHDVRTFNPRGVRDSFALDLDGFDAVVVHYSLVVIDPRYVSPAFREKLRRYKGLKVQFIQDEYRWVDRSTAATRDMSIDVLFTCVPEPQAGQLYDDRLPGVRRVHTLTGYVPESLERHQSWPLAERPLDVGYRGRDLPFWLGRLTQEKTWIGQGFLARAPHYGLKVDIGWREEDRIYGQGWIDFISSCRATLGTESGASIADFTGSVEAAVRGFLRDNAGASYSEVYEAVLRPYEGNVVVNVISPRVFEAAALGTALVMFPGVYSDIAVPQEHYIVLEKDFANMAEVAEQLKDLDLLTALTRRARADLVESRRWSYESFISEFDRVLEEEAKPAPRAARSRLQLARVERSLRVHPLHVRAIQAVMKPVSLITRTDFKVANDFKVVPFLAKGALAARAPFADPWARRIFRAGRRIGVSRADLFKELLKFSILRRAIEGDLEVEEPFAIQVQVADGGRLRFVSVAGGLPRTRPAVEISPAGLSSIEWDHSAIGDTLHLRRPRVGIGVGTHGTQRFPAMTRVVRADPGIIDEMISVRGSQMAMPVPAMKHRS